MRSRPTAPLLPAAIAALLAASLVPSPLSAQVDQAGTVLAKAQAALGGEAALAAVKGLRITGSMRRMAGEREIDGSVELDFGGVDKYLRIDTVNPVGDLTIRTKTGFNGDALITGSEQHGGAPGMVFRIAPKPDGAEARARVLANLHADASRDLAAWLLRLPTGNHGHFTYAGRAQAPDGSTAEALDAGGPNGVMMRLYFDTKSGRPLMASWRGPVRRIQMMRRGPGQAPPAAAPPPSSAPSEAEIQVFFSDYHKAGSIWFPYTISRSEDGTPVEDWTIKKVEINPSFDPSLFAASR